MFNYFDFKRERYLEIARSRGLAAALTELHRDLYRYETQVFEGSAQELAARKREIREIRAFSRQLWDKRYSA